MADIEIRPFRIQIPQADLDDLADRLGRTRWANELPPDPSRPQHGPARQPIGRRPHHAAMKAAIVFVHVRRSSIELRSSKPWATSPLGP